MFSGNGLSGRSGNPVTGELVGWTHSTETETWDHGVRCWKVSGPRFGAASSGDHRGRLSMPWVGGCAEGTDLISCREMCRLPQPDSQPGPDVATSSTLFEGTWSSPSSEGALSQAFVLKEHISHSGSTLSCCQCQGRGHLVFKHKHWLSSL